MGRRRGSHLLLTALLLIPRIPIPNMSHSTSAFPRCAGGMWGNRPLRSTPAKLPSLRRKRIHWSRRSSHLSHPAPLTDPVCPHGRVALGKRSVSWILTEFKGSPVCFSELVTLQQTRNTATCILSLYTRVEGRAEQRRGFLKCGPGSKMLRLVSFRDVSAPCGQNNRNHRKDIQYCYTFISTRCT